MRSLLLGTLLLAASATLALAQSPDAAALLVNGAIGNFECALGAAIMVTGIIGDEFSDAQLGAAQWPYDRRDANTQPGGIYGTSGCTSAQCTRRSVMRCAYAGNSASPRR